MKTMFVKPNEGRRVRDPRTGKPIPEKGLKVPVDKFWMRRLADDDVSEVKGAEKPAPMKSAPVAEKRGGDK